MVLLNFLTYSRATCCNESIKNWEVSYSSACLTPREFDPGPRRDAWQALVRFSLLAGSARPQQHFSDSPKSSFLVLLLMTAKTPVAVAADPKLETWFQRQVVISEV